MPTPQELRAVLDDAGVTFADCVAAFAAPADDPLVEAARVQYHRDGEIEIDQRTVRSGSEGSGGDYVLAWVWVDDPEEVDGDSCSMPLDDTAP